MSLQSVITEIRSKLLKNHLLRLALLICLVLSVAALFTLLAIYLAPRKFATPIGIILGLAIFLASAFYLKRRGKFIAPTEEDACKLIDTHFKTKDRALSYLHLKKLESKESGSKVKRELIEKQFSASVTKLSLAHLDQLTASPFTVTERRALKLIPITWTVIAAMVYLLYDSNTTVAVTQAAMVQNLIDTHSDELPNQVKQALEHLADELNSNELTDQAIKDAIKNAEKEIDKALNGVSKEALAEESESADGEETIESAENVETDQSRPETAEKQEQKLKQEEKKQEQTEKQSEQEKTNEQQDQQEKTKQEQKQEAKSEKKESEEKTQKSSSEKQGSEQDQTDVQNSKQSKGQQGDAKQSKQSDQGEDGQGEGQGKGEGGSAGGSGGKEQSKGESGKDQKQKGDGKQQQKSGEKGSSGEGDSKDGSQAGGQGKDQKGKDQKQGLNQAQSTLENLKDQIEKEEGSKENWAGEGSDQKNQDKQQGKGADQKEEQQGKDGAGKDGEKQKQEKGAGKGDAKGDDKGEENQQKGDKQEGAKGGGGKSDEGKQNDVNKDKDSGSERDKGLSPEMKKGSSDPKSKGPGQDGMSEDDKEGEDEGSAPPIPQPGDQAKQYGDFEGGQGEGEGKRGFLDVRIPAKDEKFDTKYTSNQSERTLNNRESIYHTERPNIGLGTADPSRQKEEQDIPLEYRDLME